jgi:hypothetical protein
MNPALILFVPRLVGRAVLLAACLVAAHAPAQETALTAKALAAQLSAVVLDDDSAVRLKLEIQAADGTPPVVLQLQAKSRRTAGASDLRYQVLWPKERKGEGFVLRKRGGQAATGSVFVPPDSLRSLSPAQVREGIFGSGLSYEDLIGNFFAWDSQAFVGNEVLNRVPCQILESKPGKGDASSYSSVRTWVDMKRLVPMQIEKFGEGGRLITRIITTRVAKDDRDRLIPVSFTVQRAGQDAVTILEGSNSRHDVTFTEADFSPESLRGM